MGKSKGRIYVCDDGNCPVRISAQSEAEAARMYVESGSWGATEFLDGDSTAWIHVSVRRARETDPARRANPPTYRVPVHPVEPPCLRGAEHDWSEAESRGKGGAVVTLETCHYCGVARVVDYWATDPTDGSQGHESRSYHEAEESEVAR